jgi:AcrR family transcriptional regulator
MPRAKQRTPELRAHLLEVAIATLSEDGIVGLTTRRVAERAGTSMPAVYELFSNKAGLLRAMFFEGFRLLGAELA